MRFLAVLNRSGGTLATMDLDAFGETLGRILGAAGHSVDIKIVAGEDVLAALDEASESTKHDVVMAAGGDGTISAAAARLMNKDKVLAVLPAGTMNLFARSLGMPLDLEAAVQAFADGKCCKVDMASANGRPFVHQYSVGMHPHAVDLRSKMKFGSRIGKMFASMRAGLTTFLKPPRIKVALTMQGTELIATSSSISVANNLYGEGHLPYAEKPDGGVLGIYLTRASSRRDLFWFFLNMAIGRWRGSPQLEVHESGVVTVKILSRYKRFKCAIDGELCPLEEETEVRIHPKALRVLVPAASILQPEPVSDAPAERR